VLNKQSSLGFFTISLVVAGTILSTFLLGSVRKAEAQITPIRSNRIPALLTRSSGRWLEYDRQNLLCYIHDFKPSGVRGALRTIRFGYAINIFTGECRFSTGAFAPSFGAVSRVNRSVLLVQYPSGFRERIPIVGAVRQGLVIRRGNRLLLWEPL